MGGIVLFEKRKRKRYILDDEFLDTRAGGAVNGTLATPGGNFGNALNTRVVQDGNSKLSIGSGIANVANNGIGLGDPGLWYGTLARVAGRLLAAKVSFTSLAQPNMRVGFDTDQSAGTASSLNFGTAGSLSAIEPSISVVVYTYAIGTYYVVVVQRGSAGHYFFLKDGTTWKLLWASLVGTGTFPSIEASASFAAVFSCDFFRIPVEMWLPTPIAYDTFTRANGALGSTEGIGPEGQSAEVRVWTGATWSVSANAAINTPTLGAEGLSNGNMEVASGFTSVGTPTTQAQSNEQAHGGTFSRKIISDAVSEGAVFTTAVTGAIGTWWEMSAWIYCTAGSGYIFNQNDQTYLASDTVGATSTWTKRTISGRILVADVKAGFQSGTAVSTFYVDDYSVKQLTLSTLFASLVTGTPSVILGVNVTYTLSTCAGLVICLDSDVSPANFIIAYVARGTSRVVVDKCVAGVYTNVISATITYVAGARLVFIKDGTKVSVYYNNAIVGSAQTVSDAGVVNNTLHGLFSTTAEDILDTFQMFPIGVSGEHAGLDKFIGATP